MTPHSHFRPNHSTNSLLTRPADDLIKQITHAQSAQSARGQKYYPQLFVASFTLNSPSAALRPGPPNRTRSALDSPSAFFRCGRTARSRATSNYLYLNNVAGPVAWLLMNSSMPTGIGQSAARTEAARFTAFRATHFGRELCERWQLWGLINSRVLYARARASRG